MINLGCPDYFPEIADDFREIARGEQFLKSHRVPDLRFLCFSVFEALTLGVYVLRILVRQLRIKIRETFARSGGNHFRNGGRPCQQST